MGATVNQLAALFSRRDGATTWLSVLHNRLTGDPKLGPCGWDTLVGLQGGFRPEAANGGTRTSLVLAKIDSGWRSPNVSSAVAETKTRDAISLLISRLPVVGYPASIHAAFNCSVLEPSWARCCVWARSGQVVWWLSKRPPLAAGDQGRWLSRKPFPCHNRRCRIVGD